MIDPLKMARKITIQDISRKSGVSPSTVSRVLTGNTPVSPQKREAVEQAIKHLNYRPNHLARSLKTNITYSVGLLLNDITNPFYSAIVRGVEEEANHHGYSLILCNTDENPERELQYLQVLQDKQVDGIILGPTDKNSDYICDLATHIPLVQIDRYICAADTTIIVVNNEVGAYRATRLLIEKGHHRICVLNWQRNITSMVDRYAGYKHAVDEMNIPIDPALIFNIPSLTPQQTAELVQSVLASEARPTAIFALNNRLGFGAISAIQHAELKMPDDIALIIFDDLAAFSLFTPTITVIRQPAFAMGKQAMQTLIQQMLSPEDFKPETIVLPTELIIRESV